MINKKMMKSNKVRILIAILGIIFVMVGLYSFYLLTGYHYNDVTQDTVLDDGWIISYGNKSYTNVKLSEFKFDSEVTAGQSIVLYNRIPQNYNYSVPILKVHTHNSVLKVSVNGKVVYEYGEDLYEQNKLIGSGYQFIDLQEFSRGKTMAIEITPTVDGAFSDLEEISIVDYSTVYTNLMREYRIPFVMGIFLIIFGFCLILLGFGTYIISVHMVRMASIGMFALCVGAWTLCKYRLVQIFAIPMNISMVIEHMAIYIGIIPLTLYFRHYVYDLGNKVMKILYYILLAIQIILMCVKAGCFIFHLNQFASQVILIYICFAIEVIYITVLMIMLIKKGYRQGRILILGFYTMVAVISLDAVNIFLIQQLGLRLLHLDGLSSIGTVAFIIVLIATFAIDIASKLRSNTEKEVLYRMAYNDAMTNVYNRRYCEEEMMKLSKQEASYGIYNFDLNKLKETNDTLGHEYGDRLIILFSQALTHVFENVGDVCRMGGDEFVVLIKDVSTFDEKQYRNSLFSYIDDLNKKQDKLFVSASYGYAQSDEMNKVNGKVDAQVVYSKSDTRMYAYKQQIERNRDKQNREI